MVETSELLRVPAFADLPEDQLAWFLSQSEELHLSPGTPTSARVIRQRRCLWLWKENSRYEEK